MSIRLRISRFKKYNFLISLHNILKPYIRIYCNYASFLRGKMYKNELLLWIENSCTLVQRPVALKSFMHPFFEDGYMKMNYHCELKILEPLLRGRLHKNHFCIMYRAFMHPSSEKRCIRIYYHRELKIFTPLVRVELHKNHLCIVYRAFMHYSYADTCIKINYKP